jgi:MFS family permease
VATASLIVALRGAGMMIFDVPAGLLVAALGERHAMLVGAVLLGLVAAGTALTSSLLVFGALMVVMGFAWAIWQLARLAYVSDVTPADMRGRALSLVGGTNRMGTFIGPFAGSLAARELGLASTFVVQAALGAAASLVIFVLIRGEERATAAAAGGVPAADRIVALLADHRRVFATAGLAMICLSALRAGRQTIIPLWGTSIGLSPALVGTIFGASNGLDMLLFYPAGAAMDRRGRRWVAMACLLALGTSLMLVPAATTVAAFVGVAMLTGLGNGLGAGIMMTLGADLSPRLHRAEFLGLWRLLSDAGLVAGPLVLSVVAEAAGLGLASAATGGLGLVGAAVVWRYVPETLSRPGAVRSQR